MSHKFHDIAFTPKVKEVQAQMGSRLGYERMEARPDRNGLLGPAEAQFIADRDSFYMATAGETGWPYLQHRGGPPGFLRVLDERTIGFADYAGNRQYVSIGNLAGNDRVALFLMDYPHRTRLKILGRARVISPSEEQELLARLAVPHYGARVEHGLVIEVVGFDWNCSQHITPRFSSAEVAPVIAALKARIAELEAELSAVRAR